MIRVLMMSFICLSVALAGCAKNDGDTASSPQQPDSNAEVLREFNSLADSICSVKTMGEAKTSLERSTTLLQQNPTTFATPEARVIAQRMEDCMKKLTIASAKPENVEKVPETPSAEAVSAARARAKQHDHDHDHDHDHAHGHGHNHGAPERPAGLPAPPDVAAAPADAEKTDSGLASKVLQKGTGTEHPTATSSVTVHYTGWTTNGEMFDSSVKRGTPASFRLNAVIPGWTEGVQLMVVGEKRRFWIPEELAYKGRRGPPQGMLVFDVELIEITKPPVAPDDVAAPPANAEKTESGLASIVIKPGTGSEHPKAENKVTVHYSGWTTDGKMFDSSVMRKQPATFPLNRVIPGWTEGVQLMVVGETRRLWIPEELAYKGRAGAPAGMLVFDVTLISIQ